MCICAIYNLRHLNRWATSMTLPAPRVFPCITKRHPAGTGKECQYWQPLQLSDVRTSSSVNSNSAHQVAVWRQVGRPNERHHTRHLKCCRGINGLDLGAGLQVGQGLVPLYFLWCMQASIVHRLRGCCRERALPGILPAGGKV